MSISYHRHPTHPGRPGPVRRQPRPDPLRILARLTGRDRALLELLAEHRVLATEHLAAWLFPTTDTTQRRLLTLYRLGVLDRFRTPQLDGAITSWRYTLGPHGAAVLAAMHGTTAPQPAAVHRRTLRLAAHPDLDHLLGVNHLLSQLAGHSRTHTHPPLRLCWGERRATDACGALARPDALLTWQPRAARRITCCLEYDTGTEALHRLLDKLPGYTDLALAGGPRLPAHTHPSDDTDGEDTAIAAEIPPLWVLFVLPTPRREAHLRERLGAHHIAHPDRPPAAGAAGLRVASTTVEHIAASGGPAGPIWLPQLASGRVGLDHLAAPSAASW
jgi:hypothetical protein